MSRLTEVCVIASAMALAAPSITSAVSVAPGETVLPNRGKDFYTPEGEPVDIFAGLTKIDEQSFAFAEPLIPNPDAPDHLIEIYEGANMSGTLLVSVYRDDSDGTLAFLYDVTETGIYHGGASPFTVTGYGEFAVDGIGHFDDTVGYLSRSSDGEALTFTNADGQGAPPYLFVRTDATEYDTNGTVTYIGLREVDFLVYWPTSPAVMEGVFQPTAATPIPLPVAAWTGLGTLAMLGIPSLRGRIRQRRET